MLYLLFLFFFSCLHLSGKLALILDTKMAERILSGIILGLSAITLLGLLLPHISNINEKMNPFFNFKLDSI